MPLSDVELKVNPNFKAIKFDGTKATGDLIAESMAPGLSTGLFGRVDVSGIRIGNGQPVLWQLTYIDIRGNQDQIFDGRWIVLSYLEEELIEIQFFDEETFQHKFQPVTE